MHQERDFTPRPYQIALYEKAVAENSIIYLPTGSGKTYIAVLVITKLSEPLHKPYEADGKRTVFLVNTVALVQQQCTFLARHTGLIVKGYSGDQVEKWTNTKWLQEIKFCQVMVMTAQIFLDLLEHGVIPLRKVNLLIFDECHHAVKNDPMRQIMQRFENWPVNQHPRVLGMTASLLNANITLSNLESTLKELEITFQANIVTVETLETVSVFSTKPKEVIEYYDMLEEHDIISIIFNLLNSANTQLKMINDAYEHKNYKKKPDKNIIKLTRMLNDLTEQINETGLYGGMKSIVLYMIELDSVRRCSFQKNFGIILDMVNTQLIKIQKLINDRLTGSMSQNFLDNYTSPKVSKLVEVLKKFYCNLRNKNEFCCIIFVQRRSTAKVIDHVLKELSLQDENFKFLKSNYVVGRNSDNSNKNERENLCLSKWNKQVLLKFANGVINCLVATDVVDEGIDIPSCTLVVRFHAPMNFRSYIQSKGRARCSTSSFVILVPHGDHLYLKRYDEFKKTERALQQVLHVPTNRQGPTSDEIDKALYDDDIEPYVITRENDEKSIITEHNAISIINTYCSSLCSSKYGTITPIWTRDFDCQFRIHLTLPVKSPLKKTIESEVCQSIDAAKRSAAFKACVELHKIGELNDNLSPKTKSAIVNDATFLFPHLQPTNTTAFTFSNVKKKYRLTHPEAWLAAYPKEDRLVYLHVIEMIPYKDLNLEEPTIKIKNESLYNIYTNTSTYGILSTKAMPEIPVFPIFTKAGVFQINIKSNIVLSPLEKPQIDQLKLFHYLIFNEILGVSKDFIIFNGINQENSFLIVPVNNNQEINWDVVKDNSHISSVQPNKTLRVKASYYENTLVLPTYRASSIYLVTEVCDAINAKSPFITEDYQSYADYYKVKHNINIENLEQPMLKVIPLSTEMNFLKPRIGKTLSNFTELLVPELCKKINFPTVYWIKAVTLPSILHRVSQLLVAEDLRVVIANQAGLDISRAMRKRWDPMVITENYGKSFNSDSGIVSNDSVLSDENFNLTVSSIDDSALETDFTILILDENLFSWEKEQESLDLERNAEILTPSDVDNYYRFVNRIDSKDQQNWETHNSSRCSYAFSERKQEPKLQMLTKTSAHGPSPADILQSLTAKTSNDIINYERLETLGDAFLKYAISLFLYKKYPDYGENLLTHLKGKMVSNSNLLCCGEMNDLAGKMNVEEFTPTENAIVPAFGVNRTIKKLLLDTEISASVLHEMKIPIKEQFSGVMTTDTVKRLKECISKKINDVKTKTGAEKFLGLQIISEKCVSDCVESVIGIYLDRTGVEDALKVVKWFGILPKVVSIDWLMHSGIEDPRRGNGSVDEFIPWSPVIENRIGYTFRDRTFLLQAFTHQTFTPNRITDSYERLEFLGDALLDFLLTVYIYETCGNLTPGDLTDLRSALVNNITFACLSVRCGLHTALLADAPELFGAIDKFVQFQEKREYKVDDELLWILLEEDDCHMSEHVDVPKVLGDLFESVIGAVYLDSGKDLQITWHVIYNLMKKEIGEFSRNVPKQPIRVLHETIGANPTFSASVSVKESTNLMVTLSIHDGEKRKLFHGFGPTRKLAKCAAAKQALKYFHLKNN